MCSPDLRAYDRSITIDLTPARCAMDFGCAQRGGDGRGVFNAGSRPPHTAARAQMQDTKTVTVTPRRKLRATLQPAVPTTAARAALYAPMLAGSPTAIPHPRRSPRHTQWPTHPRRRGQGRRCGKVTDRPNSQRPPKC
jgi:hypothetical protein